MRATPRLAALAIACVAVLLGRGVVAQPAPPPPDQPQFDEKGRPIQPKAPPPADRKITPPEPTNYVAPRFPEEAKAAGVAHAEVTLKITVDVNGKVVDAKVQTGAGHGFDEAALEAARGLEFTPARYEDGTPFKAIIPYRYEFDLTDKTAPRAVATGALSGKVLVQGTEGPLAGAKLTLRAPDGAELSRQSDAAGAFHFDDLVPGSYVVRIEAEGFDPFELNEAVNERSETVATYRLAPSAGEGVIEVQAEGEKPPREVTHRVVEKREIERIPGTNGDALRSIQSLPGVARVPGGLGALIVRGSAPFDTLTFIDGVYVPLIYHFGGLSSVVPTELLSKIDFYPGNFSARYGRAMGGIVDAGIRSPRDDDYHGLVQFDFVDARVMLEGPVPNVDGWTFAAAGRRSYLDAWLGPVLEEAGAGVTQAPRYYDYQFLVERKWSTGRFRTAFYGSDDALEILIGEPQPGEPALAGNVGLSTVFQRLHVSYDHKLSADDDIAVQLALGHDAVRFGLASLFFDVDGLGLVGRGEYSRRLGRVATMHVGFDVQGGRAKVSARVPEPNRPGSPPNQPFSTRNVVSIDLDTPYLRPAGYVEVELVPISRWRIVPGLRVDYAHDTDSFDVDPRFNTRFDIVEGFPRSTLKGGIGIYHQPPQFQESTEPLGTDGVRSNAAVHYGLGFEQQITEQLEGSIDGFYKQLDNLVVASPTASGAFVDYGNEARGYVVGAEVLLKYKPDEHFFGWLAYTLSRSVRQNGPEDPEYLVIWDQTHILTVLGSYRLGHGWEVGARFRLVSGNLTSANVCNPAESSCDPNRINALFHGASGAYTPIRFGAQNDERLPLFHSLDIRIDKAWQFTLWKLSAYLDVQNVYNSSSAEGIVYNFDYTNRQFIGGLPILPSFGLRGDW
jgi:TonB family protein